MMDFVINAVHVNVYPVCSWLCWQLLQFSLWLKLCSI